MTYLLDTNVVSEMVSRNPDTKVVEWQRFHSSETRLSCVTIGEIWKGIHLMPTGKRKQSLNAWAVRLEHEAPAPPLPLDSETLKIWGRLCAKHQSKGRNLGMLDSLLAATALRHDLIIVTRNTADFPSDVRTFNPWIGL